MSTTLSIPEVRKYYGLMAGIREFGDLIKNARVQQGLTGTELAMRMDRNHSQIVRWENGVPSNPPDTDIFWDFSEALNLDPKRMLEALGYLKPEQDVVAENEAVSAVRAILEGREFTDKQIRQLATMVRGMVEMMEG